MFTTNPLILAAEADRLSLDLMKKLHELQCAVGSAEEDETYYDFVRSVQDQAHTLEKSINRLTRTRLSIASAAEVHEAHGVFRSM